MNTFFILAGILAVAVIAIVALQKTGKVADTDGDLIPDVVEDTVEEVKVKAKKAKTKAKTKAKKAVKTAKAVVEEVKETIEEAKDIVEAAQGLPVIEGKVTKTKLRALTKEELETLLTKKFEVEAIEGATKTNLVNKVYELYYPNKK